MALAAARLTGGDVDPTCGTSLVRLGYDRDFARARRHTSTLRQPAVPAPGWRSVEFDPVLGQVRVPGRGRARSGRHRQGTGRRPGGAGDRGRAGLRGPGQPGRRHPGSRPPPPGGWRVGIADDIGFDAGSGTETRRTVLISIGGLATSGTAVRSWRRGSARLHHIIVPATGCPRGRAGARSAWPRRPAWTRTRPARRRSCAARVPSPGWPGSACRPGWYATMARR